MWIAGPDYFVSIVASRNGQHRVARARRREHLEHFLGGPHIAEAVGIEEDVDGLRDYRFRSVVDAPFLADTIAHHLSRMEYTNFKDEADRRDPELGDMYHDWWVGHWGIQQKHHGRKS